MLRVGVSVPGHKDSLFAMTPAVEAGWAVPGAPVRLTLSGTPLFVMESNDESALSR